MNHQPCILLVENDPELGELMTTYLEYQKFEVTRVNSGPDATAMIETTPFDVVVLDVLLPHLDGIAYLKWLRDVRMNDIPVIVHTSVVDPEYLRSLNELGATHVVQKPAHPDTLIQLINDCIIVHEQTLVNTAVERISDVLAHR